jgi:predicted RNA-binding Zn ribbon-like protein
MTRAEPLCLDFANTRFWRGTPSPTETLGRPEDLLDWMEQASLPGVIPLRATWPAAPDAATTALGAARGMREALYRLLAGTAEAGDLAALNAALAALPPRRRLEAETDGFSWLVEPDAGATGLPGPLAPVLWSAADLLTSPRRSRVHCCANPQCRWLFLDESRNGSRRWCSMAGCGNRAKAHRHYERRRGSTGSDPANTSFS